METACVPFRIDHESWMYVRFFVNESLDWEDVQTNLRATEIWKAAIASEAGVGFVDIHLKKHAVLVKQIAETAAPISWIIARCVCPEGEAIYTFAEAKPWQVEHPDLLRDLKRLEACRSQAKTRP